MASAAVEINVSPTATGTPPPGAEKEGGTNVLLISLKRSRFFYERAAKELLASGVETVEVSALGDAICTAVELAGTLEEKKTATIVKIETMYQSRPFPRGSRRGNQAQAENSEVGADGSPTQQQREGEPIKTAGVHITLKKHPDFKGSRITPAHVTWCPKPEDSGITQTFIEGGPSDVFASVVSGSSSLTMQGVGQVQAVAELLTSEASGSHDIAAYEECHRMALEAAWEAHGKLVAEGSTTPLRLTEITSAQLPSKDLKAIYCRPCVDLHSPSPGQPGPAVGSIFFDVFNDDKGPFSKAKNYAMIYVAAPKGSDYASKDQFLLAVRKTASNLMTALCDYSGMIRRDEKSTPGLKRLVTVRVCLFSGGEDMPPQTTKLEVANEILAGLNSEFHYGASPRLNFAYDDDVFKQAWIDQTGLEVGPEKNMFDGGSPSSTP